MQEALKPMQKPWSQVYLLSAELLKVKERCWWSSLTASCVIAVQRRLAARRGLGDLLWYVQMPAKAHIQACLHSIACVT